MIDRRTLLASMGAAIVACATRPPVTPRYTRPFAFIDAMPAFFAFWARAANEPLEAQIARFRAEVIGAHPSLYTEGVLGLHGDHDAALRDRLTAWLPTLAPIVPRMREIHASFESDMNRGVERFASVLPSFRWNGSCHLFASVDSMNGGMRKVGDRAALLFGLDVIARGGESMPPPVLFAHELFHAHQSDVVPSSSQEQHIYDALWAEGLATYASLVVCAWATEHQALPPSHLHDPARPALDIPERSVVLADVMPKYARELGGELRSVLDSQNDAAYAKFFLGRASPELGERPVRSGYWFGLRVARSLARSRTLDALSRIPAASLRSEIGAALATD